MSDNPSVSTLLIRQWAEDESMANIRYRKMAGDAQAAYEQVIRRVLDEFEERWCEQEQLMTSWKYRELVLALLYA